MGIEHSVESNCLLFEIIDPKVNSREDFNQANIHSCVYTTGSIHIFSLVWMQLDGIEQSYLKTIIRCEAVKN